MDLESSFISLFGPSHLLYILLFSITAFLLFYYKKEVRKYRKQITWGILFITLIQQIILYGSYFVFYDFHLGESLPLHISRINSLLGIIFLITKNKKVFQVLAYFGMFALLSFIYPDRVHPITHPIGISFLVNHTVTLLMPFYGMIAYDMAVEKGKRQKVYLFYLIYVGICYFINPLVGGNYFYLVHKPVLGFLPDAVYIPLLLILSWFFFMLGEHFYRKAGKMLH